MKRLLVAFGAIALIALAPPPTLAQTKPVTLKSVKLVVPQGSTFDQTFLGAAIAQEFRQRGIALEAGGIDLAITVKQIRSGDLALSAVGTNKENGYIAVAVSTQTVFAHTDAVAKIAAKKFVDEVVKQVGAGTWARNPQPAEEQTRAVTLLEAGRK